MEICVPIKHLVCTVFSAPARRRQRSQQRSSSALRSLQLEEDRLHRERERMWREKERIRQLQAELLYERDMVKCAVVFENILSGFWSILVFFARSFRFICLLKTRMI